MVQRRPSRGKRPSPRKPKYPRAYSKSSVASSQSNTYKLQAEWHQFRTRSLPIILLVLVTFIAYANAWPNALVGDDPTFASSERYTGIGLTGVERFFTEDLWAVNGTNSGLYRPLFLVSVMIDSHLFGNWAAGFHLSNILLHVLTTVLLYGLLRHLLLVHQGQSPLSGYIALLAAMIFGVHPIHTEAVNSIFNRSEILVALGTIGGLWWFFRTRQSNPKKAWFGLCIIYLLVMLCKESGLTLPALAVILLWMTLSGNWLLRLKKCLPIFLLLIPLGIFLALRANALATNNTPSDLARPATQQTGDLTGLGADQTPSSKEALASPATGLAKEQATHVTKRIQQPTPFGGLSGPATSLWNYDNRRLAYAVRFWADALRILMWPRPLMLFHAEPSIDFATALVLQLLLLGVAIVGFVYNRPALLAGLAFFYVALIPSSGIVGPLDYPFLAERFLYLPSAGLTIPLAFGLRWLAQRFSLKAAVISILSFTVILTPLTWARNAEWSSDLSLEEAEYRKGERLDPILPGLVIHNLQAKNTLRALEFCRKNAGRFDQKWELGYQCGTAYERVGRYEDARRTYSLAAKNPNCTGKCYFALALMDARIGRSQTAREYFEQAMATAYKPFLREYYAALMFIKLYPHDPSHLTQAKTHLQQSLQLQPGYFPARRMLEQVNEKLDPMKRIDHQDRQ